MGLFQFQAFYIDYLIFYSLGLGVAFVVLLMISDKERHDG